MTSPASPTSPEPNGYSEPALEPTGADMPGSGKRQRPQKRTALIVVVSIFIVLALAVALIPLALNMLGGGVKTEGIDSGALHAASTDVDGQWSVSDHPGANRSSVGFTFDEVLPGERRTTSGSTEGVTGKVTVEDAQLTAGEIRVDMNNITTDSDVRDNNVRNKIFETRQYPESTFVLTEPADLSGLADDGTPSDVELTGDLTIHGTTNRITNTFQAARSGDHLVVAGDVPIHRADYNVDSPEFVASKIAEDGEVNIRLNLSK